MKIHTLLLLSILFSSNQTQASSACRENFGPPGDHVKLLGKGVLSGDKLEGELISGVYEKGHMRMFSGKMTFTEKAPPHRLWSGELTDSPENNLCRDDSSRHADTLRLQWTDDATGTTLNLYGYNLRFAYKYKSCYTGTLNKTSEPLSLMQLVAFCVERHGVGDPDPAPAIEKHLSSDEVKEKVCSEERLLKDTNLSKQECLKSYTSNFQADSKSEL
ncbi:hypothetical protein [Endozoicomonas sp. 4G]|uniref:hypothetical protein n=1 Tax=Endozoicomonas sp. 4G TaxID=2872754 RepID=UPI0020790284|nr:hypothetical protein [Endozoicomonas sp. 4G]